MIAIRKMEEKDRDLVLQMIHVFFHSDDLTAESDKIYQDNITACVGDSPYLSGYVFVDEDAGDKVIGYSMVARSYNTEYGKPCLWIDDLYISDEYRGQGAGARFLKYVKENNPGTMIRLEGDKDNEEAVYVYENGNFKKMPYTEMMNHISGK